jgi:hypothetical protein
MELKIHLTTQRFATREIEIDTAGTLWLKTLTAEISLRREPKLPWSPYSEVRGETTIWQAFGWEIIICRTPRLLRPTRAR